MFIRNFKNRNCFKSIAVADVAFSEYATLFFYIPYVFFDAPEPFQMTFQDPATSIMEALIDFHHDLMFLFIIIVAIVFWLLDRVFFLFDFQHIFSRIKAVRALYIKKETYEIVLPMNFSKSLLLETIWTFIPFVTLLSIMPASFALLYAMEDCVEPSISLKCHGYQWYWNYSMADTRMPVPTFVSSSKPIEIPFIGLKEMDPLVLQMCFLSKNDFSHVMQNDFLELLGVNNNNIFGESTTNIDFDLFFFLENISLFDINSEFDFSATTLFLTNDFFYSFFNNTEILKNINDVSFIESLIFSKEDFFFLEDLHFLNPISLLSLNAYNDLSYFFLVEDVFFDTKKFLGIDDNDYALEECLFVDDVYLDPIVITEDIHIENMVLEDSLFASVDTPEDIENMLLEETLSDLALSDDENMDSLENMLVEDELSILDFIDDESIFTEDEIAGLNPLTALTEDVLLKLEALSVTCIELPNIENLLTMDFLSESDFGFLDNTESIANSLFEDDVVFWFEFFDFDFDTIVENMLTENEDFLLESFAVLDLDSEDNVLSENEFLMLESFNVLDIDDIDLMWLTEDDLLMLESFAVLNIKNNVETMLTEDDFVNLASMSEFLLTEEDLVNLTSMVEFSSEHLNFEPFNSNAFFSILNINNDFNAPASINDLFMLNFVDSETPNTLVSPSFMDSILLNYNQKLKFFRQTPEFQNFFENSFHLEITPNLSDDLILETANNKIPLLASKFSPVSDKRPYLQKFFFDSYMVQENDLRLGAFRLLEVDNYFQLPFFLFSRLLISAEDVIHSFAVPSLGVKMDAVPGRTNQVTFAIKRVGRFYGQCSEICGANHAFMPIALDCVPQEHFVKWADTISVKVPL